MENPIKMDDLGVPLFLETPIWNNVQHQNGPIFPFVEEFRALPFCLAFLAPPPFTFLATWQCRGVVALKHVFAQQF